MYEITGIYEVKWAPDGSVLRHPTMFTIHLNSEVGVMRFYEEQKPFRALTIKDMNTNKDITKDLLEPK